MKLLVKVQSQGWRNDNARSHRMSKSSFPCIAPWQCTPLNFN